MSRTEDPIAPSAPVPCPTEPPAARPDRYAWLAFVLNDWVLRLCALFTLILFFLPPDGLGIDLCVTRRITGAPCPGCGMTRCGANLFRGDLTRALQYHPFGPVVIPGIAALGVLGLMPRRWREAVRQRLLRLAPILWPVCCIFLGGFILFGAVRWVCVVSGIGDFPATWP